MAYYVFSGTLNPTHFTSLRPKFHPNWFTSGGVIAERMNTIQTRHVVFPILGKATASSLSNRLTCTTVTAGVSHKNNL